jgi:hypothetical protein
MEGAIDKNRLIWPGLQIGKCRLQAKERVRSAGVPDFIWIVNFG